MFEWYHPNMAESITKRNSTLESDEKSVSVANSKVDEHLIQNWSLTFTDYATNNQYADKPGIHNGTSENRNNQLITKRAADGRDKPTDPDTFLDNLGHPVRNHEGIANERIKVEQLITEKISVKLPQADEFSEDKQSVSIEGRSMNIGISRDRNSEHTRDTNSERYKKSESVSIKSKLSTASGKSVSRINNTEAVRENTPKEVVLQYGKFSKRSILPIIGMRLSTAERMKLSQTRRTLSGGSARRTEVSGSQHAPRSPQNVPRTPHSVSRPQQNMPRTQNGYGGKVQPIYVRLPGQRTGQMML